MPTAICFKSHNWQPSPGDEEIYVNPYGDFDSIEAWNASIRQSGEWAEEEEGRKKKKLSPNDGQTVLIYDVSEVLERTEWMAKKAQHKLRGDRKAMDDIHRPRLSAWMKEDVSDGVVYVSLRDVGCEFDLVD